jgi:hypothetical protein
MRLLAVLTFLALLMQSLAQPCCTPDDILNIGATQQSFKQLCKETLGKKGIFNAGKVFVLCEAGLTVDAAILVLSGIGAPVGATAEVIGTIICGAVAAGDLFFADDFCDFTAGQIAKFLGCSGQPCECATPCPLPEDCAPGQKCVSGCCVTNPCGNNPPCLDGFCSDGGHCFNGCCTSCGEETGCPDGICTEEDAICLYGCCVTPSTTTTTTTSSTSTTTTSTTSTSATSCSSTLPATITCPPGFVMPTVVPCECCFQNLCSHHPIQCACLCACFS